ncbi:MAG: GNAT superfamily N-acetyltransferase [Paraglaciecola sp.]|jgi:GNAT superfamily N-acetyltransferase
MPVHLEHIRQPTQQDWIDLSKIYSDAPQEWLSDATDIQASLQQLLDKGTWLIAGRFNARLLGALEAKKNGNNITLSHFCVRKITINRGVAHQMFHHLGTWADKNGFTLVAKDVPKALVSAFKNRGFVFRNNDLIRNHA